MTVYYERQGECNRCGQCCGAPGTGQPDRRTPFPKNWPEAIRYESLDDIVQAIPQVGLCGLGQIGEDTIGVQKRAGTARIQGKKFPYVWVRDVGLVKDTSQNNDGSSWAPECPFLVYSLIGNPGATHPHACGLVGTNQDGAYKRFCEQEPRFPLDEDHVLEWQWRYPDCSYTWVEIPGD